MQQRKVPHEHLVQSSTYTQISQFKFLSTFDDQSNLQERLIFIRKQIKHSIFGFLVL